MMLNAGAAQRRMSKNHYCLFITQWTVVKSMSRDASLINQQLELLNVR